MTAFQTCLSEKKLKIVSMARDSMCGTAEQLLAGCVTTTMTKSVVAVIISTQSRTLDQKTDGVI